MNEELALKIIAHVKCDLNEKFGAPRQSGLCKSLMGRIVFEPEYRVREALREIEGYSHLWVLWWFHQFKTADFSPTVRPPKLGGNTRVGVFASRSPNRPNPIGMSCVKLEKVEWEGPTAPSLLVSGIDMIDGTPVLDVKPYIPYTDCRREATGGFAISTETLRDEIPEKFLENLTTEQAQGLRQLLRQDPRPGYQKEEHHEYGLLYAGMNIRFTVYDGTAVVIGAEPANKQEKTEKTEG